MFQDRQQRLALGRTVITTNVLFTLDSESVELGLRRHAAGDWGELEASDWAQNEAALRRGDRLVSVFYDQSSTGFHVITESDGSATVLLPQDY